MKDQTAWKNCGSSSSPGTHIQYASCEAYPGVNRITVSYAYDSDYVAYVVSGMTHEYKTPERAAWAAVAAGVAPAPLREGPHVPDAFLGLLARAK